VLFPQLGIQVHTGAIADRVGLHKSADVGIIISGAIIVKTCFDIESPACEHIGIGKEVGV